MRKFLVALMLALVLPGGASARQDDLAAGSAAMHRHDFAAALEIFGPLAKQGDAVAQYNIGFLFDHGYGVPQNDAMALDWYLKAAGRGLVEAQYVASYFYRRGRGLDQDTVKAHMWINLAASGGLPHADVERREQEIEMTRARRAEAQRLAVEWLAKHPRPHPCPPNTCPRPNWLPKADWNSPFWWYGL